MKIQRVICDYYNRTYKQQDATCDYKVSEPIIDSASNYRLQIETAEVNLTTMPLDLDSFYLINIIASRTLGSLVVGDNFFRFPSVITNVNDFLDELNSIFTPDGVTSFGEFELGDDGLLIFKVGATEKTNWDDNLISIDMNIPLFGIFKFVCGSSPKYHNYNGQQLEFRSIESFIIRDIVDKIVQKTRTINKLAKFKSVRFMTTLPVRSTKSYKQTVNQSQDLSILTSIKINSANFDLLNQNNLLYIPNEIREVELASNADVSSFRIYIEIYYSNGELFRHKLNPGEYFEISLNFREYK